MRGQTPVNDDELVGLLKKKCASLVELPPEDRFSPLLDKVGNATLVLIGEASHGTHQFFRLRAEITQRLIAEKGFNVVAIEADWPDAYRVNRFVQLQSSDPDARAALSDFKRFPAWMWRNTEMVQFVDWLQDFNRSQAPDGRVAFYGLDLYSLYASMEAAVNYLEKVDPEAANRARYRYGCFEQFDQDPQQYGYATSYGVSPDCEDTAVRQLIELRQQAMSYLQQNGFVAQDEQFFSEQHTRLVRNAEKYYREMFRGRNSSWNLRDRHMFETLSTVLQHINGQTRQAKIVVWAHNSHVGDARYTEMSARGEFNVGQLVKENFGVHSYSIAFSTYTGTVSTASDWGATVERKQVRPALPESYEALFHQVDTPAFWLDLQHDAIAGPLREARLERAIGVIYRPQTERLSHYFYAQLSQQFDSIIHIDESDAVR